MFRNDILKALKWSQHSQQDDVIKLKKFVEKIYGKLFDEIQYDPFDSTELTKEQIKEFQEIISKSKELPSAAIKILREDMPKPAAIDNKWILKVESENENTIWFLQKKSPRSVEELELFCNAVDHCCTVLVTLKNLANSDFVAILARRINLSEFKLLYNENALDTLIIDGKNVIKNIDEIFKAVEELEGSNIDAEMRSQLIKAATQTQASANDVSSVLNIPKLA